MNITNNFFCNKIILFILLFIFCNSSNNIFVKSDYFNPINGTLDKPNVVYASNDVCGFLMYFELTSGAVPVNFSTDGFIVTVNSKESLYKLYASNLQIGNGTINLTIYTSNKQILYEIPYSCLVYDYSKLQFKIISKLFNHHQQYKATFQILNSAIPPIPILNFKCTNVTDCKLIQINRNTYDIIFYQLPVNYKDNWVLEFGSIGNKATLSFVSPFKGYSESEISNINTPSSNFVGYGQNQVARYSFAYMDNGSSFFLPPAFKMIYTTEDVYDIVRKPKVVEIQNQLIKYEGKTVKRPDIALFSLQYDIESNFDVIQFPLTQTNLLIGAVLNEKSSQPIGNIYEVAFTSTKLNFNLRYLNSFIDEILGVDYKLEYNLELPFGLVNIDDTSPELEVKISIPIHSQSNFVVEVDNSLEGGYYRYETNVNDLPVNNLNINKIEWYSLDQGYFILRVNVSDSIGLRLLRLTPNSYGNAALTQSSIQNNILTGIYEYKFSYLDSSINFRTSPDQESTLSLSVSNGIIQFEQTIPYNQIISLSPTVTRFLADPFLELLRDFDINSNIKKISFLNNKMDVTDKDGWNLMFLEFKDTVQNYEPMLSIIKDVSEESYFNEEGNFDSSDVSVQYYFGKWNKDYSMYIIEFYVPKNIKSGYLSYSLSVTYNKFSIVYNQDLPASYQLTIVSTKTDFRGPIITDIGIIESTYVQYRNYDTFGWNLTISDSINGFKDGFVVVRGLGDYSLYNFTLSKDSIISGDIYNSIHQIKIITPNANCGTKVLGENSIKFELFEIYLVDSGDNKSHFKVQGELNKLAFTDPLLYNQTLRDKIVYEYYCSAVEIVDWVGPSIESFQVSPSSLNVLSSERKLDFSLRVQCDSSINIYSLPIVYLSTLLNRDIIKVPLSFKNCSSASEADCYFGASFVVPYSFGYPDGIYYSIYGVLNGRSGATGLSSSDINKFINTSLSTTTLPFISSTGQITTNGGPLRIEGLSLQNTKSVLITFSDSSTQLISPSKVFSTSLLLLNVKSTKKSFTIKAISSNNEESNIYTINPIETIEIPINTNTPKPISCPKDKDGNICSNNGECINNQCVCRSPWIESDCGSKVIIIPQPEPSTREPSAVIVVEEDDILKSIISVVQLRELNIDRKPIKFFKFETWERTNLSLSSFQYISTIKNNNIDTPVNVTLQFFENSTTIEFANEIIEINPSTLKYTITIGKYEFESNLNTLQLVMLSSVSSNANDCSYKEFNNQTSSSSDYLKLQIKGKSLYGRYIKRGILDNLKIISISNDLLDKDLNLTSTSTSTSPSPSTTNNTNDNNNLVSYIGINIPYYEKNVMIDPDWSVLSNYNKNENQGESYCGKGNKKGLSSLNILGICLGGFFAVVGAAACYLFVRGKKKKRKQFLEKLRQTELSMRNTSSDSINNQVIDFGDK